MEAKRLAQRLAEESIVLLKNEECCLPLASGASVAVFGRGQIDTLYSGNGSGSTHAESVASIEEALRESGLRVYQPLTDFYARALENDPERHAGEIDWSKGREYLHSGLMYEIFGQYHGPKTEFILPDALMAQAAAAADTALLILSRSSGGEECDRRYENDYLLTASEQALVRQVCGHFGRVVLILNINGLIDLGWTARYPQIKSMLFLGIPGEGGSRALASILTGRVNPSGRLGFTIAERAEDYPSWRHFSCDKEHPLTYADYGLDAEANGSAKFDQSPVTVYAEDVFMGYRYFDSFGVKPLYAFGHGLSYTSFSIRCTGACKEADGIRLRCAVTNTGDRAGKEVLQAYIAPEGAESSRPARTLAAFGKTGVLQPGETQAMALFIPWEAMRRYDEAAAAWRIERGNILVKVGATGDRTRDAACIRVPETILLKQCENRLGLRDCNKGKLVFPQAEAQPEAAHEGLPVLTVSVNDCRPSRRSMPEESGPAWISALPDEQLAALCVGYGPGTPFSAFQDTKDPETLFDRDGKPLTVNDHPTGRNGYISPAIPQKGLHSVYYKDGPAGVGGVAWPAEMLLGCCWNTELLYTFGDAVGRECEREQVDVWLAPAVNLHRHPLCGRNFEYFSEDPFLTGAYAVSVARGVQEHHPVLVCAKHFAANEQETFRRGSLRKNVNAADSILTERALRELYLLPFEMLVKQGSLHCLMTSFNRVNGVFAGGSADLCTHILREEWGFDGLVVTDWGDMDVVVDGADAVVAGNDVVMPGGPPVIRQILAGLREGRVTRSDLERTARRLYRLTRRVGKGACAT